MFLKLLVLAIESALFQGGVYFLSGVKEKRQESEINTIVWVLQLLLAGIVYGLYPNEDRSKRIRSLVHEVLVFRAPFLLQLDLLLGFWASYLLLEHETCYEFNFHYNSSEKIQVNYNY